MRSGRKWFAVLVNEVRLRSNELQPGIGFELGKSGLEEGRIQGIVSRERDVELGLAAREHLIEGLPHAAVLIEAQHLDPHLGVWFERCEQVVSARIVQDQNVEVLKGLRLEAGERGTDQMRHV